MYIYPPFSCSPLLFIYFIHLFTLGSYFAFIHLLILFVGGSFYFFIYLFLRCTVIFLLFIYLSHILSITGDFFLLS